MMRASSAPCGRGSKNQKFSFLNFRFSAGGVGGADKKWKGNFWFLLRRFHIGLYSNIVIKCKIGYAVDMKKGISKKLGENIKRIRTEKGMTQGDIFRALDLDRGYVSSLEGGKRNPTLAMIEKIAKALGVSVDELLK